MVSERIARAPQPRGRPRVAPLAPGTYRIQTGTGEIAWRIDPEARRAVIAGGEAGSLAALEARLAGGGAGFRPPTPNAAKALEGGIGGLVVDAPHLVASVRALPEDAFGTGPSGFVMRSVVDRLVEPASRLSAVSLRTDLAEDALLVAVELEARPLERGER
jgi:hypothetical protein